MQVLITVLSDDRLASLKDGPQILRAINILMVKVIEMSDQTYVLGWVSAFVYSFTLFFTQNNLNDWNWWEMVFWSDFLVAVVVVSV